MIVGEGWTSCKENYAAKRKYEYAVYGEVGAPAGVAAVAIKGVFGGVFRQKGVDEERVSGIMKLAPKALAGGDGHDHAQRRKNRSSPEARSLTPPPGGCEGRVVLRKRVLRPSRYRPGEVRNAPPRFGGWASYHPGDQDVWILPSIVLSRPKGLYGQRPTRTHSQTARSQTRSQTLRGGHGFHLSAGQGRQISSCTSSGRNGVELLWDFSPSQEHRTCVEAIAKKRAIEAENNPCQIPSAPIEEWRFRYEDLRGQFLKQGVSSIRGWGLALFISQGLVAWMMAWPDKLTIPPSRSFGEDSGSPSGALEPPALRDELVILLANMVSSD